MHWRRSSDLTDDNGEIHVNARVLQLHYTLRYQVLVDPSQFGALPAILGDNCLLIEFMGKVPVLVVIHGAAAREDEGGGAAAAARPGQGLLPGPYQHRKGP